MATSYLDALIDPRDLVDFVRQIPFPNFTLEAFLPNRDIADIEYAFTRANLTDADAAKYRSWDAEAEIGKRQGVARVRGEIPPISKKIRLGEEQRLRQRMLETGDTGAVIRAIFDDAAQMTRSVQARVELARGSALYDGRITLNENGVQATVDFGMPAGNRVTPGSGLWTDTVNSDPINDLLTWVAAYVDLNGEPPGTILTSLARVNDLLRNAKIRTQVGSLAGTPGIVAREQLNQVLGAFELPPIATYDVTVRVDGVATRPIPADRVLLLPGTAGLGNTFWGTTAEALALAENARVVAQEAPGLIATAWETEDPVATWTKASAVVLPVVANPQLIITADVA